MYSRAQVVSTAVVSDVVHVFSRVVSDVECCSCILQVASTAVVSDVVHVFLLIV